MTASGRARGGHFSCWASLAARDLPAAQAFYGSVLGWEWRADPLGEDFRIAFAGGSAVASLGACGAALQAVACWIPFFTVPDVDETVARVHERGGTVGVGPLSCGTGRAALAADRDGAAFGVWARPRPAVPHGERSAPGTRERRPAVWPLLRTRDAFAAAMFYGEVFDWASGDDAHDGPTVAYEDPEVVVRAGGKTVVRLRGEQAKARPDPPLQPRWRLHFRVPDVDTAAAAARSAGGGVADPPATTSTGRRAIVRDPEGSLFTVTDR
ncbi:VOC family protein [Streptomyces sp. OE57]|uniref:VOC family protein n=1 Tax=Streptomyces lacaronensis TaxID=3379885 RepID=UPI0039B754A6